MICRLSVLFFAIAFMGMLSCKNNDEVFTPVVVTGLNVVNASTDTINFYLNGTRQNNGGSLYPGSQTLYLPVPAGAQNYQFKKAGGFNVLFSVPLNLKDSVNNSLYITGETADKAFHTVDFLDTTGIINFPRERIRFVNATSDAGSLTASIDSASYSTVAYQATSEFRVIGSGPKEIKIYQAGTGTVLKDTSVIFQPNRIYTVFSRGLLNGKGSAAFNIGVAINY